MQIQISDLMEFIRDAVPGAAPDALPADGDALSVLGMDSIATLKVLMDVAERYDLDLETVADTFEAPHTIGDLRALLDRLPALRSVA